MADKKISQLPASTALEGDDFLAVVEDSTTVQAPVTDLLDVPHTRIVVKDSPTDVRHPDFGGVDQTGTVDASPAIQAAIDYITGPADPTTTARSGTSPLYIPAGVYNIETPITIESVIGFHLYGDGKAQTYFRGVGTMDAVFDLNGVSRSTFGGFSIIGTGTEQITNAIWCQRDGTLRSSNYSTLHDIAINYELRCVYGIHIGQSGQNTQNDTWKLDDIEVIGQYADGETTWWQSGIHIGTGAFNNNLNHHGYDLNVAGFRRNFVIDACQFSLTGFEAGEGETDFYVTEAGVYLCVQGGRCEGSKRMLDAMSTGSAPALVQFSDIDWKGNDIHADGRAVSWRYGGSLSLKNVRFFAFDPPGDTPRIQTLTSGNLLDVTLDGISVNSTLEDFLTDVDSTTQVHIRNGFAYIDLDGGINTRTYGSIDVSGGAATDIVSRNRLNDDDYDRYQLAVDGTTYHGVGTAAPTKAWNLIRKRTGAWHNNPLMGAPGGAAPPALLFPTINRVYYTPWYQPGDSTISAVAVNMTAGGTASNVLRIGIFADDGSLAPGTVLDQGTVAGDAIAVLTWTPSSPVAVSDLFWLAIGPQGSGTAGSITTGYMDTGPYYGAVPDTSTTAFVANHHRGLARYITSSTTLASNPVLTVEREYRNAWFQVKYAT